MKFGIADYEIENGRLWAAGFDARFFRRPFQSGMVSFDTIRKCVNKTEMA
jgi:hypothetical protein